MSARASKAGAPARLGGLVQQVLAELGYDSQSPALQLMRGWRGLVGPEAAAHCEPWALCGGVLEICTDSPVWSHQLQLRQAELLEALGGLLGEGAPQRLRFRVRG